MTFKQIEDVAVYCIRISEEITNLKKYLSFLSADEVIKAERFYFEKDKNSYITCRGSLREILSHYLMVSPTEIVFNYNKFGKPCLSAGQNACGLRFNLSHSGDYCLIAISRKNAVGIDIEKKEVIEDYIDIARNTFSEDEYYRLIKSEEGLLLFYSIWTQKEAIVKAMGKGISFGLNHWSTKSITEWYKLSINSKNFIVKSFSVNKDYASALSLVI